MMTVNKKLTFAISDIHGHYEHMLDMISRCLQLAREREADLFFVFCGDYIDRGPESAKVVEYLMNFETPHICLKGNHEDMACTGDSGWLSNGGWATIDSYNIYGDHKDKVMREHLKWMSSLPLRHEDEFRHYVHAGFNAGVSIEEQTETNMLWIRNPFLTDLVDFGKLVIHGHSPYHSVDRKLQITPYRINIDTAACFGGHMTALVFNDEQRDPISFIQFATPRQVTKKEIADADV
jgi:serine/threonine protein phosphatase 1